MNHTKPISSTFPTRRQNQNRTCSKLDGSGGAQHQEDIALVEHSFGLLAHDKSLDGK
jgi:hypothetical protein